MRKLTTLLLGLSLGLGTAGLSLAAQAPKKETKPAAEASKAAADSKTAADASKAPKKKHTRKHKKNGNGNKSTPSSTTPAPTK